MKRSFLIIFFISFISFSTAQVINDSCLSATELGGLVFGGAVGPGCYAGISDIIVYDSTDFAVANFPYPTIPSSCFGYSASIASPAKDLWYRFETTCDFDFVFESTDTVHLSIWNGTSCATLYPLICYTIIPGTFQQHLTVGASTVYFQVSGPNNSSNTKFTFCLAPIYGGCIPIYNSNTPTPVLCFPYSTNIQDCSGINSNDGTASISITGGTGPFTCLWSDSISGLSRSNLAPGIYYYSITDNSGCIQNDSVIIGISTGIFKNEIDEYKLIYEEYTSTLVVKLMSPEKIDKTSFTLFDLSGKVLLQESICEKVKRINVSHLSDGIYIGSFFNGKHFIQEKIIIYRN